MVMGDDAIRENIYSPFTKQATTPRKRDSLNVPRGSLLFDPGGLLWGTAQGIGGGLF